jgi:hypothetical protein
MKIADYSVSWGLHAHRRPAVPSSSCRHRSDTRERRRRVASRPAFLRLDELDKMVGMVWTAVVMVGIMFAHEQCCPDPGIEESWLD